MSAEATTRGFRIEGIPAYLTASPRWVVWRYEKRNGKLTKLTKIPYSASGNPASSTDSATWAPFNRAVAACRRGFYNGVGFVLGDGVGGIDLDDCRLPDGGLNAAAKSLLRKLDTYTEWSPSGTGAKAFLLGSMNGHPKNRTSDTGWAGALEVYDSGRYFTVTGDGIFGFPTAVNPRQEALDKLLAALLPVPAAPAQPATPRVVVPVDLADEELVKRARGASNGDRFAALYDLGCTAGYPSASEAELALAAMLVWWAGGDLTRADALFRASGLYREKWDSKRGETTYGALTLAKALEGTTDFFNPTERRTVGRHPWREPTVSTSVAPETIFRLTGRWPGDEQIAC